MADKMMRMAGRSRDGKAKAIQTDNYGRIEIKPEETPGQIAESFTGAGSVDLVFKMNMDGFVISNDGDSDIDFYILDQEYKVKANEVFEGVFPPFRTVFIKGDSEFRAYGASSKYSEQQKVHYFISDGVEVNKSSSSFWKGTETIAHKDVTLVSLGAWGDAQEVKLFELDGESLSKELFFGNLPTTKDMRGFRSIEISNGIPLEKGKSYLLLVKYGTESAFRRLAYTSGELLQEGEYLSNPIFTLGSVTYNVADEPIEGMSANDNPRSVNVYAHRLKIK